MNFIQRYVVISLALALIVAINGIGREIPAGVGFVIVIAALFFAAITGKSG